MKWEKRPVVCMKKRSSRCRGSRERAPAAKATATHRWERIHALGEGGESAESGGGSARPSHGASVADSPLTYLARDVVLPIAAARTELAIVTPSVVGCCHKTCDCSKISERGEEQKNPVEEFGKEQEK